MKYPILCLFLPLFLNGCFIAEEDKPSAVDYVKSEENQTRHFRPVHRSHPEWTIGVLGKNMKLRTENEQIRLSTRRNPNQLIVRENGHIVGHVQEKDHVISFIDDQKQQDKSDTILLKCDADKKIVLLLNQQTFLYNVRSAQEIALGNHYLRTLDSKNRYTISEQSDQNVDSTACTGTELESPFNPLGTMIFHTDLVSLSARTALSWYVTVFDFKCEDISEQ